MRPGDTFRAIFTLSGSATGTPSFKLVHNGSVDTALGTSGVIACTAGPDTNQWLAAVAIPSSGYAAGDTVEISATATVSGTAESLVVARDTIAAPVAVGSVATDAISAASVSAAAVAKVQAGLPLGTDVVAIKAKTDNLPSDPADQSLVIAATDAVMARLGTPAGASIAADLATKAAASTALSTAVWTSQKAGYIDAAISGVSSGGGGGGGVVTGYADGQAPDELVWAAAERTLTNVSGVTLSGGTVSASPSPTATTFRATGLPAGLVTGDLNGMSLIFQGSESNTTRTGMRRTIATTGGHTVSGSTHTFVLTLALGAPPAAGDTFDIG